MPPQETNRFSQTDYIPASLANLMLELRMPKIGEQIDPRRRPLVQKEIIEVARRSDPRVLIFEDDIAQVNEIYLIRRIADQVESWCGENKLPLPTVHAIHTGKTPNPFPYAVRIGRFAENKPLELLPAADIAGHAGELTISRIDDTHTYMAWEGRGDHTYEWVREKYGDLVASRKMNVIKELIRRQRERGENPIVVTMYMAGVAEENPLVPGDLGVVVEHFEEGPYSDSSRGHNKILEKLLGVRFQPIWGRMENPSSLAIQKAFMRIAQKLEINAGPMVLIGDAEATKYEGWWNYARSLSTFRMLQEIGFVEFAQQIYGNPDNSAGEIFSNTRHKPSLGWGMGNASEALELFRTHMRKSGHRKDTLIVENDFPLLSLAVLTDAVGPHDSQNADHMLFLKRADERAPIFAEALKELAQAAVRNEIILPDPSKPDDVGGFSLPSLMFEEADRQADILEAETFKDPVPMPSTLGTIHTTYLEPHIALLQQQAELYRLFGYPELAERFDQFDPEYAVTVKNLRQVQESLKKDGQTAYQFFVTMRNRQLSAAEGRMNKIAALATSAIPKEFLASEKLTAEFQEKRRQQHLHNALWHETAARLVAEQKTNLEIVHINKEIEVD